ncbi:helix-turn-helix domain-containing protein [Chryseobacterium sp. Marseille-Q3244]|uniref:helix-turn-helix domain-containing protein n=1 Tax=Chryseobacterium sp. Marseille-Q3244 TaxID=2758092 RepID=UPI002025A8C3|nr:helix-turn-helix domain-containing protein [Chryseobacterium sp. Marseille-Q3244]
MKVEFYKPKNNILKNFIEGYYFIADNQSSDSIRYLTFPNNFCILSVICNSDLILGENQIIVTPSVQNEIVAGLVFRYNYPIEVICEKPINEITIYFKPLGLNYFVNDSRVFSERKNVSDYNPFSDFKNCMNKILNHTNREEQIELLESFWLSKFQPKDFSLMKQILSDIERDLKIEEIAKKHNLSRQYINKLFIKNIGKTPSEYRKIYRFRNAVISKKKSKNLTDLSHGNLFFDQSHFIKDFKELTAIKPSLFFKNVDTNKENVWLFI